MAHVSNSADERETVPKTLFFNRLRHYGKRVWKLVVLTFGDLTAIALGVSFFWLCTINILLAQKTVNLNFLESNLSLWFSEAFDGKSASISQMDLNWRAHDNNVILELGDIVVDDNSGETVQSIESLKAYFRLRDVASGKFNPVQINAKGGQFTLLRDKMGEIKAGLGSPDTVGRLGPVWRGDSIQASANQDTDPGLSVVSVQNATIFVRDEKDGLNLNLDKSDISAQVEEHSFTINGKGDIKANEQITKYAFNAKGAKDLSNLQMSVNVTDANPYFLSPKRGRFSSIGILNAPLDLEVSLQADNASLVSLDVNANIEKGTLTLFDRKDSFDSAKFSGTYQAESDSFDISNVKIESDALSLLGTGRIGNIGSPSNGFLMGDIPIELSLSSFKAVLEKHYASPVILESFFSKGLINREYNKVTFERFSANFGEFEIFLDGLLDRNEEGKTELAKIQGGINGTFSRESLLQIWPENFILGARNWIKNSVLQASLHNLKFSLNADGEALSLPSLPNAAFEMTFDLSDGAVRYIRTMTPVTNAFGRGVLEGNRATFYLDRGAIDSLILTNGQVSIPRIYPYGGEMIIEADAKGSVTQMLQLIDQRPFEYVSKYGVDAAAFKGEGELRVEIKRPLRERIKYSDVTYAVNGKMSNVSAPFSIGSHSLNNGHVYLLADSKGLSVKGPVNLGPWQADLAWTEKFDAGLTPTQYKLSGIVTQDDLDNLGLALRAFLTGQFFLEIDAIADGLDIREASLNADLAETDLRLAPFWSKPKGERGQLSGKMAFIKSQGLSLDNLSISAPDLDIVGDVSFAENFQLLNMNLSKVKIAQFVDAAIKLKPSVDSERFDMFVTGDYLNVAPFIASFFSQSGTGQLDVPVLFTGSVNQLALDDMYVLRNANALFAHNGEGVTQARLKGDTEDGSLSLNLTTNFEEKGRRLTVDIPNASDAAFAFFNLENILGGQLNIGADMPLAGQIGPVRGAMTLQDSQIVNVPILASLLSLASLQGLTNTLSGEGLKFDTVDVPFSFQDGVLSLREARAAGPALGMTGNGEISFTEKSLDLDGVLVPAYTANSLLGDIPLIGDIFVGRRGEGVFALSYSVQGPFKKSQVGVNPLSAFTPGFLRDIFRPKREALPDQLLEAIKEVKPKTSPEAENPR